MNKPIGKEKIEFWKDIVLFKNGKVNKTQMFKELADYSFMMEEVPKVYCAVTNERLSKLMYPSETVISEFEDCNLDKEITQDDVKDMIKDCDSLEELKKELKSYFNL